LKPALKLIFIFLFNLSALFGQTFEIIRIEPPNWWEGMNNDTLQLMIHGKDLSGVRISSEHEAIKILNVHSAESPNYLFVDIDLSSAEAGNFDLIFSREDKEIKTSYTLLKREHYPENHKGFSQKDVLYLIMADRFCDGNPGNNKVDDSLDEFTSFDLDGRKGGDLEGIISKLDYLKDLGITTIWITPTLENNMWMSYHGYAATNLYRIDPRFGSNKLYKDLVNKAHSKDLKIVMDHVSNHIGINHWWMKDLPFKNWINGTPESHLPANHNKMTFPDPYSPGESVDLTWNGWFTDYMVDLNQADPFLKKYLIQNTIWWIEYLGIDGIREDTFPYCDQYAMSDWLKAIFNEYPKFNIVGEIWTGEAAFLAAYQQKNKFGVHLNTNLPCVTDFAMADAFRDYLSGRKGLEAVFNTLAQDFLYYDPANLLTFFDNHDISRGLYIANGNIDRFKNALTILLTTRGIPKLLYGSEVGITGEESHGTIRSPFPGGFTGDKSSAFTEPGRNSFQKDIFNYTSKLLKIRKRYSSLSEGVLTHFYPFDKIYVYFRKTADESIMIIINDNNNPVELDLSLYRIQMDDKKFSIDLLTDEKPSFTNDGNLILNKNSSHIYLLD
jgi:glycosidase